MHARGAVGRHFDVTAHLPEVEGVHLSHVFTVIDDQDSPRRAGHQPLEFPRREAADVNVELVDAGAVSAGELDLELHLVASHGQFAHCT